MSRFFYLLAVVVLIAACSDNTSAQCYRDGHCSIFENSHGQVPTQMTRDYRRPALFPRLKRLIRILLPPYGPGI